MKLTEMTKSEYEKLNQEVRTAEVLKGAMVLNRARNNEANITVLSLNATPDWRAAKAFLESNNFVCGPNNADIIIEFTDEKPAPSIRETYESASQEEKEEMTEAWKKMGGH